MKNYIATDADGNVVGKWRRSVPPSIPDDLDLQEVDDVTDHEVDHWFDKP